MELEHIKKTDDEVAEYILKETKRQLGNIELIASENFVSPAVMEALGTALTNKYAEGYPGRRYYGGCEFVDVIEEIAIERAKKLFGAEHANVQPHSGAQANMAAFFALLKPGDTILGMNLAHGGHLTHGSPVNMSGKYFNIVPYGVSKEDGRIDYDELRQMAKKNRPKMILAGASAYSRMIDFRIFKEIAEDVGAYFMVDMAHIAGLVAAGLHPNPVEYADVVTTTTHKTLRGPRGGMILCRKEIEKPLNSAIFSDVGGVIKGTAKVELAKTIDSAVFPGQQGGPLMHVIAAKAVSFKEALSDEFKAYQNQILKNAAKLAGELKTHGFSIVSGGTDNHLMLIDLTNTGVTGKEAQAMLDEVHITANKNGIPFDTKSPFVTSGIRIGTPAVTTRGMKEAQMVEVAKLIKLTLTDFENSKEQVKNEVKAICDRFPAFSW